MIPARRPLISEAEAARRLGISRRTFAKRRAEGHPVYQPTHTDPDSGRRTYDWAEMEACRRRLGELRAEMRVAS